MVKPTDLKPFGGPYQKAMKRHARQQGIKGAPLAILSAMLDYINWTTGQTRPGIATLIDDTGYCEKTLERGLKCLRDTGMILPIAYLTGGRGRATCYGFPLPAWSGQNPRHSVPKPPTICPQTPDKMSVPTERTYRTGNEAAPRRRDHGPAPAGRSAVAEFGRLVTLHGYAKAKQIEQEALRAAENDGGRENFSGTSRAVNA